jgi:hypothetical protein
MTLKQYREAVEELRTNALRLVGLLIIELPDRTTPRSAFARQGGSTHDNTTLRAIAGQIDQVLLSFNRLQEALGLPAGAQGRFARFLKLDPENEPVSNSKPKATKPTPKADPKPAPKPKPSSKPAVNPRGGVGHGAGTRHC